MKKVLIGLIILTITLLGISLNQEQNTIIIYASSEQFRNDELQKQLNEKFPELNVYVMYVSTAKAAAKISVEGSETDADILLGLETAYLEKIKNHLEPVTQYSRIPYVEDMTKHDNRYVIWERQAGSIVINNDVLKKYNLPMPKTYEDLLNPVYKNLIAMPDPKSSGTGYFFYKGLDNVWGSEKTLEYFDKLSKNIKQFTESGSGPIKLLIQGEVAIGLGLTFQAVGEVNNNQNFTVIEPEFGSPYSLTGTAMIQGRANDEDITRVFEYIVNEFMVYDKEYFSPGVVYEGQINKIDNYPKNIRYADMQGIELTSEKERLLNLWKY